MSSMRECRGGPGVLQGLHQLGLLAAEGVLEEFDHPQDAAQRSPDLVAHHREEVTLRLVGGVGATGFVLRGVERALAVGLIHAHRRDVLVDPGPGEADEERDGGSPGPRGPARPPWSSRRGPRGSLARPCPRPATRRRRRRSAPTGPVRRRGSCRRRWCRRSGGLDRSGRRSRGRGPPATRAAAARAEGPGRGRPCPPASWRRRYWRPSTLASSSSTRSRFRFSR